MVTLRIDREHPLVGRVFAGSPLRLKNTKMSAVWLIVAVLVAAVHGNVFTGRLTQLSRDDVFFLDGKPLRFLTSALPAPLPTVGLIDVEGHFEGEVIVARRWREQGGRKKRQASQYPLLSLGRAAVRVALVSVEGVANTCTADVVTEMWNRRWGIREYFAALANVSESSFQLEMGPVVSITLPGSYSPTLTGTYAVCVELANNTMSRLPPWTGHTIILVSSPSTDCGLGASPIDCFPNCYSVAWTQPECDSLGLMLHETMHAMGLFHSNLELPDGLIVPYGDGSCQMGLSIDNAGLNRRGVSVPQLKNLGLVSANQIIDGSSNGVFVIATGYTNSASAVKMIQLGNQFVSFRCDDFYGVDNNVNVTVSGNLASQINPLRYRSFADAVFVHRQAASGGVGLLSVLLPGESYAFNSSMILYFLSHNGSHASVAISNSGPPREAPLSAVKRLFKPMLPVFSSRNVSVSSDSLALVFDAFSVKSALLLMSVAGRSFVESVTVNGVERMFNRMLEDREQLEFPISGTTVARISAKPEVAFFTGLDCGSVSFDGRFQCGPRLQVLQSMEADVNGDGHVNMADVLAVLKQWGPCVSCRADMDANGQVDLADMAHVMDYWTG